MPVRPAHRGPPAVLGAMACRLWHRALGVPVVGMSRPFSMHSHGLDMAWPLQNCLGSADDRFANAFFVIVFFVFATTFSKVCHRHIAEMLDGAGRGPRHLGHGTLHSSLEASHGGGPAPSFNPCSLSAINEHEHEHESCHAGNAHSYDIQLYYASLRENVRQRQKVMHMQLQHMQFPVARPPDRMPIDCRSAGLLHPRGAAGGAGPAVDRACAESGQRGRWGGEA